MMQRITSWFFLFTASTSFAAIPGIYIGAGAGYGLLKTPDKHLFAVSGPGTSNTTQRGGLAGRAFVGYNASRYIGIEGGFARYARSRYAATLGDLYASLRYYAYEADGVLKIYIPFGCSGLNIYGLGGAAVYMGQEKFANGAGIPTVVGFQPPALGQTNIKRTRPIYGGGVSFDFGCKVTVNGEFTQVYKLGSFASNVEPVPYANLYTLNLAYHFS